MTDSLQPKMPIWAQAGTRPASWCIAEQAGKILVTHSRYTVNICQHVPWLARLAEVDVADFAQSPTKTHKKKAIGPAMQKAP